MAQSALTVTPPNPSPPTNYPTTGATGPNPPNYTKTNYNNVFNLTAVNSPILNTDGRPQSPYGVNPAPAPYFDDGISGAGSTINEPAAGPASRTAFAANTAALAGGTAATSGGTENTYPGIGGLTPPAPNMGGAVPASTSVAHEGAGTEVVNTQTYSATILNPAGPLVTVSAGLAFFTGVATGAVPPVINTPNATHASSLSPAVNPTISATPATTLNPVTIASGTNTFALTVTGVGFTRQSVVYINGIPQATVFVNSTTLTVAAALKKTSAGTLPVTVVTGGAVVTANSCNMTYT